MAINGKSLATIQNNVTGLTTNETDFRSGMDDIINQVDDNANLAVLTSAADLTKLNEVSATSTELNVLDGITSSTQELNILNGVTANANELNILDGLTATTAELNLLDGITATKAEINKLDGFTGSYLDLNKIAAVTATANELNILDGFTGNTADLNRTVKLDQAGDGANGQMLTWNGSAQTYQWTTPSSFTWIMEDGDGTEVNISTQEVKFVEGSGIDINWTDISTGSDADPFDLTFTNTDRGSSQNIFKNIAVAGQSTIVADSNNDTLTIAGNGISVATDANSDTMTLSITAGTNISLSGSTVSTVTSPSFTNVTATNVTATDVTVTGALTETSDIRLKENIKPLTNSLDKVMRLEGVSYNKIATPWTHEIGFIAQNVEEVLPELALTTSDGTLTVAYGRTVALLVEAIKELKEEIDSLKK